LDPAGWADPERERIRPTRDEYWQAVLTYIGLGYRVFPLAPGSKRPILPSPHRPKPGDLDPSDPPPKVGCKGECGLQGHGCYDATLDPDQAARWFHPDSSEFNPPAWIGLATGGRFDVLDLDLKVGADGTVDGVETILGHAKSSGHTDFGCLEDPDLIRGVRTPSDGCHIYLRPTPGATNHNPIKKPVLLPGVDYKAQGGYVAAPPSWSAKRQRRYTWVPGHLERATPPAPPWLSELVVPAPPPRRPASTALSRRWDLHTGDGSPYALAVLRGCFEDVAAAQHGSRNSTLNSKAYTLGRWVAAGELRHDIAESELVRAAIHHGDTERHALVIIRSAMAAPAPSSTTIRRGPPLGGRRGPGARGRFRSPRRGVQRESVQAHDVECGCLFRRQADRLHLDLGL